MKKFLSVWLILAMLTAALVGCGPKEAGEDKTNDAGGTGMVETLYSPNFSIERLEDGIKKVIDGEGRELILVPKTMEEVPEAYAESIVIRTPVENAVFLSDTQVCTFRDADQAVIDGICGVSGTKDAFAGFDSIQAAMDKGDIVSVGGGMGDPDYELIQSLNPDVVFVYTGSFPQSSQIAKLEELGINYAVDNEYMETNYMARMEWGRFLMTFFDADEAISAEMLDAQKTIDEVKATIDGLENPTVALFSVYDGQISPTSDTSWLGTMLADMGGKNVFSGSEGPLSMEAGFELIQSADVIIYSSTPTWCPGMDGVLEAFPLLTDCEAYETGRVYQYTDAFWTGIDQTDVMAADLASVCFPDTVPDREMNFFVQLEK